MSEPSAPDGTSRGLVSEMFVKYGRLLARSVARLVRPQDIDDVVQETYIRVFQAARNKSIRSPQAFMLRTARNIAFDRLACADALNHVVEAADTGEEEQGNHDSDRNQSLQQEELTPDRVLESEEEFVAFCRATRALPRQCRRAFLLRKIYGLSQREVAARLGVSEGTVEKHIAKAMFECVQTMQANGHLQWQDRRQKRRLRSAP